MQEEEKCFVGTRTTAGDKVKEKTNLVKVFGQRYGFIKLTDGYFPGNEIESLELAAIAVKLIKGMGVYRPVSDGYLKLFLVLTEFIDTETAKDIKDKYVECSKHKFRRRAYVCQHLTTKSTIGFEEASETLEDMELGDEDDFQAWCTVCEMERQKEDGWNDKSEAFAKIKLVCEKCYFEMKESNLGHK